MIVPQKFCQRAAKVRFSAKISVLTDKNVSDTDKKERIVCVETGNGTKESLKNYILVPNPVNFRRF